MRIPKHLWIGGILWTIEMVDEIPKGEEYPWWGDCHFGTNKIRILKSTAHNERDTLWHEIKHACLGVSGEGAKLSRKLEEDIVAGTTPFEIEALLQLGWLK